MAVDLRLQIGQSRMVMQHRTCLALQWPLAFDLTHAKASLLSSLSGHNSVRVLKSIRVGERITVSKTLISPNSKQADSGIQARLMDWTRTSEREAPFPQFGQCDPSTVQRLNIRWIELQSDCAVGDGPGQAVINIQMGGTVNALPVSTETGINVL